MLSPPALSLISRSRICVSALFLLGSSLACAGEVAIGVFAYQGEKVANADWTPVIRYLNQAC